MYQITKTDNPNVNPIDYSLEFLESLPTLAVGQADNLKIDSKTTRVWLSRCTVEDGEPFDNKVTVETLENGIWADKYTYQAI